MLQKINTIGLRGYKVGVSLEGLSIMQLLSYV